jgi:hypothetical protein
MENLLEMSKFLKNRNFFNEISPSYILQRKILQKEYSRPKTFLVDQNQFICLPKVVDQNRIFSLPKTFLVDQKSCAKNFAQFSIFFLNQISKQF